MRKATIKPNDRTLSKAQYKAIDRLMRRIINTKAFNLTFEKFYMDSILYGRAEVDVSKILEEIQDK